MNVIKVVWGKGDGRTKISAFDKALFDCNIHNFNLINLSSIIPPNSKIVQKGKLDEEELKIGEKKHVVMAKTISEKKEKTISAGLGWYQSEDGGIFFEAMDEYCKEKCQNEIEIGIKEMVKYREWEWEGDIESKVIEHEVKDIGCVVVVALYNL